jgi:ABC-type multidrug transport system ATPase subunit
LCTRIAVLNRGRKVFEGALADTRRNRGWLRLRTDDFAAAAAGLGASGLVVEVRKDRGVRLAEGAGADAVVRWLVAQGRPVFEIAPEEPSLEDFYLSLMSGEAAKGGG